ncbi:hypothetical protein [Rhizobium sp.]
MENWTWTGVFVAAIGFATLISLLLIYKNMRDSGKWSLSDALSEEVELSARDTDGKQIVAGDGTVIKEIVMKASSSRLIALLGSVAIMMLYIGAGLSVLYAFASGAGVPKDTGEFSKFFLWGMVLFAPYVVNKFASIFGWLK